jgi:hypothetical protein
VTVNDAEELRSLEQELDEQQRDRLLLECRADRLRAKKRAALDARDKLFRSWRRRRWDAQKIRELEKVVREFFG